MSNTSANSFMIRSFTEGLSDRSRINIIELFDTVEKNRNTLQKQNEILMEAVECYASLESGKYYGPSDIYEDIGIDAREALKRVKEIK